MLQWGDLISEERIGGVYYRMYIDRPRRVEDLLVHGERWGNRPHIFHGDRDISFADLLKATNSKAAQLRSSGVKSGDRVFLLGWNGIEWVVNFWACLRAGAVPVLANAWWSTSEVENGLTLIQPALVLADPKLASKIPAKFVTSEWAIDITNEAQTQPTPNDSRIEEDTALIIFTSGTSGSPKAVVLSHRALLARLQMTLHITRKLPHQIDGNAHDVTLISGPLFHVGGMQTLLRAVIVGDSLVLLKGRFDPVDVLDVIERHKVNRWNAVPTMVTRLLDHPDVGHRDLTSLKSISIGGAPVHRELMQRVRIQLPSVSPRIPTGYGLTENGGQATASAGSEDPEKLGSTGRPLPCVEVSFLEHQGLPDGEVLLRSPTQMSGYFGMTESPIDAEGWLHTGDLGRLDEKGNLWITGRCKDMIIRGGENIAPAAVERALVAIDGVTEAAVFGIPHTDLGEEVMAIVVVDRDISEQQLQNALRNHLASFAAPSRWQIRRQSLPTNDAGKVDKKNLSAEVLAALTESVPVTRH